MKSTEKSFGTKEIAATALLLSICIASQVFKNLSVFITGPIVNTCIILTVLLVNLPCALAMCVITPVTAYFIASSPVMQAVPGTVPLIMLGNAVLAVAVHFLFKPTVMQEDLIVNIKSVIMAFLSSCLKGIVMAVTISLWLLPKYISEESPLHANLGKLQMTFSAIQLATALIGFVFVFILLIPIRRMMDNPSD